MSAEQDDSKFGLDPNDFHIGDDGSVAIGDVVVRHSTFLDINEVDNAEKANLSRLGLLGKPEQEPESDDKETPDGLRNEEAEGEGEVKAQDGEEGEKVESSDTKAEGDAPAPPSFTPEEWKLVVDGEEIVPSSREELIRLAQQGTHYTKKTQEVAEMKKKIAPHAAIIGRMESDPAFLQHIRQYGNPDYVVDGPEPVVVTQADIEAMVEERSTAKTERALAWSEIDKGTARAEGIPTAKEAHARLLEEAVEWTPAKRAFVDSDPVAYRAELHRVHNALCKEKGVTVPSTRPPVSVPADKADAIREGLKGKEVAKEAATVASAKAPTVTPDDGRLRVNKLYKQAKSTGRTEDWAAVLEARIFGT